uniref:C-type lectin domain-containing protein n=1 Tax=Knipowitschia caucasica TaxID=637954 RepID=A0AAV2KLX2_KNICA
MNPTALWLLLVPGLSGLGLSFPQKTFHLVQEDQDWSGAQSHCQTHFVDLASVADPKDLSAMTGLVQDSGVSLVRVGLRRQWQWVQRETQDQRETEIGFRAFADGEPRAEQKCGMIQANGEWRTEECGEPRPFICYDENVADSFVRPDVVQNWGSARNHCRTKHLDLASVHSADQNAQLVQLLNGTKDGAWIGLTHRVWSWSDGSHPGFLPWTGDTPRGEGGCAALDLSAEPVGLVPCNCSVPLPFYCYSFPVKQYTVQITMSAAEGAVALAADAFTKLVQSRLSALGVTKDLRLSWRKRPQKVLPGPKP